MEECPASFLPASTIAKCRGGGSIGGGHVGLGGISQVTGSYSLPPGLHLAHGSAPSV